MRALVGAGKTGVSSVPGGGNRISISGTTPSLTSSSAIRSGRVGEVAQDRGQPLLQEVAVGVVAAVVDRPLGLRRRPGEVDDDPAAVVGQLGQRDPLRVQPRLVDAVVLGVVLPDVRARRGSSPGSRAGTSRWSCRGSRRSRPRPSSRAVALEQLRHPAGAHQAGRALGVEVGRQRLGHPRVAGHDLQRLLARARPASQSLIGGTIRPSSNTEVAFDGIEPGTAPPMSSWWPNACTNATTSGPLPLSWKTGAVTQRSGQVADAALGQVDVVVEEHVARPHRPRSGSRAPPGGPSAEYDRPVSLRSLPVVDAGAVVVGVADHRRPRRAADRRLDLHLDRREVALDDLDQDRLVRT